MDRTAVHPLSRRLAFLLFALVILSWGLTWTVTKILVQHATPLWTTAIRCAIASAALFIILLARGQLIIPKRGDLPVVLTIALLHMVAYTTLVALGLKFVPLGRSIVLGYTTPLWVAPGAWLFLRERPSPRQLAGIALGLVGLALMFNPWAFDWSDAHALLGNSVILLAAFCWAANILYVRAHKWISTPFQLVFWQALLACCILSVLALCLDGAPRIAWSPQLAGAFLFAGLCGTALAYWAMAMVNRSLPAVTTSLGLLATPVVGVVCSTIGFGETISASLLVSMLMILGGIALGTPFLENRASRVRLALLGFCSRRRFKR
jgi:drug/metabolite transporter (DMT)-like permease